MGPRLGQCDRRCNLHRLRRTWCREVLSDGRKREEMDDLLEEDAALYDIDADYE